MGRVRESILQTARYREVCKSVGAEASAVLAALAKCKRRCGAGAPCLSELCHMNKLS